MRMTRAQRVYMFVIAAFSITMLFGCAGFEYNTKQKTYPYFYIHKELQEADRAVEAARQEGKDKECPEEFKAAEDLKNKAYDEYAACHTREGIALAREATAKAKALCPPQPAAQPAPAEEAPLAPVPAAEPSPGHFKYCITLHIEYDIDRALIRPGYHDEVAKVGDFMSKYPETSAVIEGHSDNVGAPEHNMELSRQRAESVANYLVEKFAIDRSRLSAKGYGSTRPVADNATDDGKQKNRRIEAIIDCAFDFKEVKPPERLCVSLQMEFDAGKADIKPEFYNEIAKVGDYMNKYPTTTALIEGHTDNIGGSESNMRLSRQRAESVVGYLADKFGIERSRLSAKGYGFTRRIAYNDTPEGRQKNRRINAVIDCVISK